ncbi:hypothetical protein G7062_04830 [Erysipelothrix sp. HDW6C]|uniref:hypothetical protein n=1 Tax=Erysipelothrix sp. HDW6C TaxID=2714930 RepID=UPI00140CDF09|nr:hypothetical protein [Erysipelothrix sp. HDW6C]QIK69662.1 hypothetical protein G7062_04830 [Erysipelothrix sp. HDW6C]
MRKIIVLFALLVLGLLLTSITYSYWEETKAGDASSIVSENTIKIGYYEVKASHPIGAEDYNPSTQYLRNAIVFHNDEYYVRFLDNSWQKVTPDDPNVGPWNNPFHIYTNRYIYGMRYFDNDLVIMNDVIYFAENGGASNITPEQSDGYNGWKKKGTTAELSWKNNTVYKQGSVVYYNDNIYVANKDMSAQGSVEPGTGYGWNLKNRLHADAYSIYTKHPNMPIIVAANDEQGIDRLYLLKGETNVVNGVIYAPGTNNQVWSAYPFK